MWCSAAIGAICALASFLLELVSGWQFLVTNIVLRPLAYRLYPAQQAGAEQEMEVIHCLAGLSGVLAGI
jgi:uncharacterized membrane protein YhiD involved in acid resistance